MIDQCRACGLEIAEVWADRPHDEADCLHSLLGEIHADLLLRGDHETERVIVVNLSSRLWRELCDSVERTT